MAMKNSLDFKFIIFTLTFLISAIFQTYGIAQEISGGVDLAAPGGDLAKNFRAGFGLSARYEKESGVKASWIADVGILSFSGKGSSSSALMLPIQGGMKYYFKKQINGPYVMGELGLHLVSVSNKSESDFSMAPGVGFCISDFDFGLKYQSINSSQGSYSYCSFRVAYIFPSNR